MMVYETCILLRPEATAEGREKVLKTVQEVITQDSGEVLVNEDWGVRTLAQPTSNGVASGNYIYLMYKSVGSSNQEIERRLRISEDVMKFIVVKLGTEKDQESLVKNHANPFNSTTEDYGKRSTLDKERRMFTKRKSCWFTANKEQADWKNPSTYMWLVNEFGKISPARVSGISAKHQTIATKAIKRARCMGLMSNMTNAVAR
jgi:ribosomal protein S6/ribosomal protein S18